jgi:glycosyltransferase involved in cell wall biosynthesis
MKILFLNQTAQRGGAELSLFSEVTHLPHTASVLLFEDGPLRNMFAEAGVTVETLVAPAAAFHKNSGPLTALRVFPAMVAQVQQVAAKAEQYDVIYANSQKAFVIGAFAASISQCKLVWRLRDVLDAAHFNLILRRIDVHLANANAKRVIVNSTATARAFMLAGGDARLVSVAYPGIDQAPFSAVPAATVAAIRTSLCAGPAPLIGVFGRLAPWKGQDVFIDAIARLPGAVGVIAGTALFGEDKYVALLHRQVAALGLESRIHFLGFRNDIPALMRAMDVIVHSSTAPEPFGRVVVEGMLAGRPVVASAAGGVLEIIEHGKTGWLYEPGNAASLAETLRNVLEYTDQTAMIAACGLAHSSKTFTIEAGIRKIDEALGCVMN